jgi:hypothetical protein
MGSGDEEVLDALAGHLAGRVVDEGVEEMTVVADLVAVGISDHAEFAGRPCFGGRSGDQGATAERVRLTWDWVAVSGPKV